jgi:hypothetical protein
MSTKLVYIIRTKLANKAIMSGAAKMDPPRHDRRCSSCAPSTAPSVRRIGRKKSIISTLVGTSACWFSNTVPSISHDRISNCPTTPSPGNQSLTSIFENQHSGLSFYDSKLKFSKYIMICLQYYYDVKVRSTPDVIQMQGKP